MAPLRRGDRVLKPRTEIAILSERGGGVQSRAKLGFSGSPTRPRSAGPPRSSCIPGRAAIANAGPPRRSARAGKRVVARRPILLVRIAPGAGRPVGRICYWRSEGAETSLIAPNVPPGAAPEYAGRRRRRITAGRTTIADFSRRGPIGFREAFQGHRASTHAERKPRANIGRESGTRRFVTTHRAERAEAASAGALRARTGQGTFARERRAAGSRGAARARAPENRARKG